MKTVVQAYAENVVADLLGLAAEEVAGAVADPKSHASLAGIDIELIILLIEAVMSAVMEIIENCPANDQAIRMSIQSPSTLQRVLARRVVRAECRLCAPGTRWLGMVGDISTAMLRQAAKAEEAAIDAAIDLVRDPNNWLL